MKQIVLFLFVLTSVSSFGQSQINGSMSGSFPEPAIEDGKRNIILQNRCGNRLSLLMYDDYTNLEFVYKPNAFRRKELFARNFSSRDNFTYLFKSAVLPMINANNIVGFDYDPFITKLKMKNQWDARNEITVVNIADENVFAIAAKTPLLIQIKPHKAFDLKDGLLTEHFSDRGENIVSYIAFNNIESNRLRILQDGTHVIQIFENEIVYFGGEENDYQVNKTLKKLKGLDLTQLVAYNEATLANKMNQGIVKFSNPDFQKVLDINHRIAYSGIDEGGACFGAINRLYYLIWVRDGSMTSSLMARAGNPELIKIWARFLLSNPSMIRKEDGSLVPEFLQILGSRWTRTEDDGLFYAALSLYSYFKTTGEDDLLHSKEFNIFLDAIDQYLMKTWNSDKKLMVSNTIGETPLKSDPYFGYDMVTGNLEHNDMHMSKGKELHSSASLYNQINTYNIMMIASELISQRRDLDKERSARYLAVAHDVKTTLNTVFLDKRNDCLYSGIEYFVDGTQEMLSFEQDVNPWEGSWATAIGPFFPVPDLQLKTARFIYKTWPVITKQGYGYCPWNTISKVLTEYGMSSTEYETMLSAEIKDANTLSVKYPMPGGLTEYNRQLESWRALPFSAGSLFFSMASQMISSLPNGLAIRASNKVDSLLNFRYKLSTIQGVTKGNGDVVNAYVFNGDTIENSLQLPESKLKSGNNYLTVIRGKQNDKFRLFSSTVQLMNVSKNQNALNYSFNGTIPAQIQLENADKAATIELADAVGKPIEFTKTLINNKKSTLLEFYPHGDFSLFITLKK